MDSFATLITSYGITEFAEDIGVSLNTAKQMRTRNAVAAEHWDAWVRGAQRRNRLDVTLEKLAELASRYPRGARRPPHQSPSSSPPHAEEAGAG